MEPGKVTIIVASHGSPRYLALGQRRAVPSATDQGRVVLYHDPLADSVSQVRNDAVDRTDPQDWICFLDSDDELAPGYTAAMPDGDTDRLLIPAIQYVTGSRPSEPKTYAHRDIMVRNPCPIGTLIHRSMFDKAGQFWNERAWEDWSLFRRAVLIGAELSFCPDAVYVAHMNNRGRNSTVGQGEALLAEIIASHTEWLAQ